MRPPERVTVTAERLDEAGYGVGPAGRLELRVADLLPGERAEVAIAHRSRHRPVAWAEIARRLGPLSPDRVEPACPAFGRCGGCRWQHLAYPAQLDEKRRRLESALAAVAGAPAVEEVVPSPRRLGYRSKATYVVGRRGGRVILGAYAPRSHEVVDTDGCRVIEPVLGRVAAVVRDAIERSSLEIYDERARTGALRYVIARSGVEGLAAVALVTTAAAAGRQVAETAAAIARDGAVRGVAWIRNDTTTGAIAAAAAEAETLAGDAVAVEDLGPARARIPPEAFFQVNRDQARALYRAAAAAAGAAPGRRALDLYCGAGGIAFALAGAGAEVVGVERHPAAVAAAREVARQAGISDRVRFEVGDAAAARARAGDQPPDVVCVNPPRKGLEEEARRALAELAAPAIVYVSCGPASLARDCAALAAAGYRLERVQPFDLMPGTAQVEAVARLARETDST